MKMTIFYIGMLGKRPYFTKELLGIITSSGSTPSVRLPSVRPSVCPSVRNTLGCQVCVICNSKSFHSFLFKLCPMIVHILKMCTSYFVHVS